MNPKQEVDEFGFIKREGGFAKWKKGAGGGPSIMDLVSSVLDPSLTAQLEKATGDTGPVLKIYAKKFKSASKTWQKTKEEPAGGGVPIFEFHKTGLRAAMEHLHGQLEKLGDEDATTRAAEIMLETAQNEESRSTDLRRGLDQMLQELIVAKCAATVFPKLDNAVKANKKVKGPLTKKVKALVRAQAEGLVRKSTHKLVLEQYKELGRQPDILPSGMEVASEGGKEDAEDEYGFSKFHGGYKAFKSSAGGGISLGMPKPDDFVAKVLDAEMKQRLKDAGATAQEILDSFKANAQAVHEQWLVESGVDKQLKKAKHNTKKLARISIPLFDFQRAGLSAALEALLSKFEDVGGEAAVKARDAVGSMDADAVTVTAMRRQLDMLLQDLVLHNIKNSLYPELESKLSSISLPKISGMQGKVRDLVFGEVEGNSRKQVHALLVAAFETIRDSLTPPGCTVEPEPGAEEEEEEEEHEFPIIHSADGIAVVAIGGAAVGCAAVLTAQNDAAKKQKGKKNAQGISADDDKKRSVIVKSYDHPKYHSLGHQEKWEVIRQFYATHDPSKTEQQISDLIAKPRYAENFGSLCKGLEKKYAVDPVDTFRPVSKKQDKAQQKSAKQKNKQKKRKQKKLIAREIEQNADGSDEDDFDNPLAVDFETDTVDGVQITRQDLGLGLSNRVRGAGKGIDSSEIIIDSNDFECPSTDTDTDTDTNSDAESSVDNTHTEWDELETSQHQDDSIEGSRSDEDILSELLLSFDEVQHAGLQEEMEFSSDSEDDETTTRLFWRVRGGEEGGEGAENEEESDEEEEEPEVDWKQMKAPLKFDKSLLDQNQGLRDGLAGHLVKRYREIGDILDSRARTKLNPKMGAADLKTLLDETCQDLSWSAMALALDPEIVRSLDTIKYTPEGAEVETVLPSLFKTILTKSVENVTEGLVREQIHKLMLKTFDTAAAAFKATVPGLDGAPVPGADGEEAVDLEAEAAAAAAAAAVAGGLALVDCVTPVSESEAADMSDVRKIINDDMMNRILYQLQHVRTLLAIYEKHTKNGQAEWFHLYGQNSLDEAKAAHRTAEVLATPTLSKKEAKRKAKEDKQVAKEAARLATKIAKRKAKLAKQEQKRQAKAGISPRPGADSADVEVAAHLDLGAFAVPIPLYEFHK
eukprot:COSAG02_NODE_6508_length_3529_cov_3.693878_1_plen_1149_part_10